jgi:hypothetical protein
MDRVMAQEDPEDPFSQRSVEPEELAAAIIFLLGFCAVFLSYISITYGH